MCELFGLSANRPTEPVTSLALFRRRGGETADNPDGWGLAYREGRVFRLHKEPEPAARSALFAHLSNTVRSDLVVAHVRKANPPTARTLDNTHPFIRNCCGQQWVFAHNGKVPELTKTLGMRDPSICRPAGQTDSEYAFCCLLDQIAIHFSAAAVAGSARWVRELAAVSKLVSSLGRFNFLMSDGRYLIAYGHDRLHSVEHRDGERSLALVATEPLTQDEPWEAFVPGELRVYRAGRRIAQIRTQPKRKTDDSAGIQMRGALYANAK